MTIDVARLDATETVSAIKEGSISPQGYAEALAQRAADCADLNALQTFDPEYLIRTASKTFEANPEGRLSGLPLVAKDNINTTAYPTSGGTKSFIPINQVCMPCDSPFPPASKSGR